MAKIIRGANSAAFAAMTTKGFEFSRDLAREEGMDLGIVVLGETANNPPAAVMLDMPPGCRLPRHAHDTHRMEIIVRGSIITPDGEKLLPGDVSLSDPGEFYGPLYAGSEGCLTIEIFSGINGLAPVPDEGDDQADRAAHIAAIAAKHSEKFAD